MGQDIRERRIQLAQLAGVSAGYAGRFRKDLTRDQAVAELQAITSDPDVLAEAAAVYLTPRLGDAWPYADAAVQLLVDAGAEQAAIERHVAVRKSARRGLDLGALADQARPGRP